MTSIRERRWDSKTDDPEESDARLNEGWRDLVEAFASLLPFQLRTVDFTGPAATLSFAIPGITQRPAAVILGGLYRIDTGATSAITLSWTYANAMVTTTSFSGLAATRWRATFLVIGATP
jgi:hypothetical protein